MKKVILVFLLLTSCTHEKARTFCTYTSENHACSDVTTDKFSIPNPKNAGEMLEIWEGTDDVCVDLATGVISSSPSGCEELYGEINPDPEGDGIVEGVIGKYKNSPSYGINDWMAIVTGPQEGYKGRSLSEYAVQMEDGRSQPIDVIFLVDSRWAMFDAFGQWYGWEECGLAPQGDPTSGELLILNEYGRTGWQQDCLNQRGWKIICEDNPNDSVCANLKDYSWPY